MNVFTRITRIFRADIHGVMDRLEDRELLLKQYLREMDESLHSKKLRGVQLSQRLKVLQQEKNRVKLEMEKMENFLRGLIT